MADWETTRRQLVQLLLGGVDPSIVEQGVTHPMDPSASPPEIKSAREKRSFVDMAMGGEYADRPIPTHALAALNKGWDPQTAMGIQQSANLIEQVMEAKVAQGSRSAPKPAMSSRNPSYRRSGDDMAKAMNMTSRGRGFADQGFKHTETVKVTFPDGGVHTDQIKGLNRGHAIQRARGNWPDAIAIESIPESSLGKLDRW